jgi:hypothetical protein
MDGALGSVELEQLELFPDGVESSPFGLANYNEIGRDQSRAAARGPIDALAPTDSSA